MTAKQLPATPNRFRTLIHALGVWLAYSAILAAAALPHGLETELRLSGGVISLFATNDDMSTLFGQGDAGAYARGAKEVAQSGWFVEPSYEILWPPGYFVFQAAILRLVGAEGPAVGAILLTTVGMWAAVFVLLYRLCRLTFAAWLSFLIPLSFLLLPFFRQYFLREGVVYSESLSAAFWTAGMLLLLLAVAKNRMRSSIGAGLLFALAAYVRGQVDFAVLIASAIALGDLILFAVYSVRRRGGSWAAEVKALWGNRELQAVVLALITFHIATMPYRLYKTAKYSSPLFSTADYYYKYLWLPASEYPAAADFILEGGGPVACVTNPGLCNEISLDRAARGDSAHSHAFYKKMAVVGLVSRPAGWITYRAKHLPKYWFSAPSVALPAPGSRLPGSILAVAFVASLAWLSRLIRKELGYTLLLGMATVYVGHFIIFLFIHYEVRYLYWLQASTLLFFVASLVAWRLQKAPAATPAFGQVR